MPKLSNPHHGSLQFWPRKRAEKILPSVNWSAISVKDSTEHSMTKGKKIVLPVTILEAPNMKVFSVRFYKYRSVVKDVIVSNDRELKRKLRTPKEIKPFE